MLALVGRATRFKLNQISCRICALAHPGRLRNSFVTTGDAELLAMRLARALPGLQVTNIHPEIHA